MTDDELQYFYFGFHRVLRRYRSTSILGWIIVLFGCISAPFGWNLGRPAGVIEVLLTVLTILAGLSLVWQNISALQEYIRISFPLSPSGEPEPARLEIQKIMREVDDGGWQEAYAAIAKLKDLQQKYGLPVLPD